ncbi:MAG TPA: IPTL-CTERM sorting domain-containing protein [Usitatibacter sp.]|nr:IPTL-CTERM sorting domain-containing protein [Usitatibacter sp.]
MNPATIRLLVRGFRAAFAVLFLSALAVAAHAQVVTLAVSQGQAQSGALVGTDTILMQITVNNTGTGTSTNTGISFTVPGFMSGVTWSTFCDSTGTCPAASGSGNVNFSGLHLSPSSKVILQITGTIAAGAGLGTGKATTVTVTDPTFGSDVLNFGPFLVELPVDMGVTVTDGVTTAVAGSTTTYTVTATNHGSQGSNVLVSFPIAGNWTCAGTSGGTCTASGAGNIADLANLPVGAHVTYTDVVPIPSGQTGTWSNTATLFVPTFVVDSNAANDTANDSDTLVQQADLSINLTDGVTFAVPGQGVSYTITAINSGPSNVIGAHVVDTFPASLTATWTCASANGATCTAGGSGNINDTINMPSGSIVVYTVTATISPAATGTLTDVATITAPGGVTEINSANNSSSDSDTLAPQADVSITVTDGVTTATPGGTVTYTITASNSGPSNAPGAQVVDGFPAAFDSATWTCIGAGGGTCTASGGGNISDFVNLPAGGSVTYTVVGSLNASATGTIANTVTVFLPGGVSDPSPGNNSATDTDTLAPRADLSITVTDGVTNAVAGGSVIYTITAASAGPSTVIGATVADTFPASLTVTWTCSAAGGASCAPSGSGNINDTVNLLAGGSVTYIVSATISPTASGTLVDTATISAPAGLTDPTLVNNSATDTDTLVAVADLSIQVSDGVTTAVPGTTVTYTIAAVNSGPSTVAGATVADVFPASITATWTCASANGATCGAVSGAGNIVDHPNLPPNGLALYTVTANINPTATGNLVNTATITAPVGVTDSALGNNSATDTDTLTPQADLQVNMTDGVTTAVPGTTVTYTIAVANVGPSASPNSTFTDVFPASITATWTCVSANGATCTASGSGNISEHPNLPPTGIAIYTVTAAIASTATGTLTNTATVAVPTGVTDPNPADNTASDSDTLLAQPDLSITLTDGVTSAISGQNVTYTIVVSNAGPSIATGAKVIDVFPAVIANATWTCVGAGGATCGSPAGIGDINETVNVPVNGTVTYTVIATLAPNSAGTLTNTATVGSAATDTDPNLANNSATDTDAILLQTFAGPSASHNGTIIANVTGGGGTCTFDNPQFLGPPPGAPPLPPTFPEAGITFPYGLFDFTLTGCAIGSTVTIKLTYPTNVAGMHYWKYGPTAAKPVPHWYVFPAQMIGNTASLTITDGGLGDDDLAPNGVIRDQGGPALGGNFAVPTLSEWMLLVMALMLLGVGVVHSRRRA